ncbi:TadE/TadG family type IV pilus assembly protein [Sphingomonas sp.]|uniref:TadE/TadG family type IV pilus assembly protein n=1 Tax=Sphingomonas sp. TaxID=28214 RepID=UPI003B00FA98
MTRLKRLARDTGGTAMLEFALSLPLVLPLGLFGIEMSNYALTQLKLSQVALVLADNASRVGVDSGLSTQELREADVNDVIQGARLQGGAMDITTGGRITLSSLEVNSDGGQWIHWQRCAGLASGTGNDSSYGVTGDGATGTSFQGMGETGAKVTAPPSSAVMFVEINYTYTPLVSHYFVGTTQLRSTASMIVRDNRLLSSAVTNDAHADSLTCDKHTT